VSDQSEACLSVKLYPDDDHWVMLEKATEVARDIRRFVDTGRKPGRRGGAADADRNKEHQSTQLTSL